MPVIGVVCRCLQFSLFSSFVEGLIASMAYTESQAVFESRLAAVGFEPDVRELRNIATHSISATCQVPEEPPQGFGHLTFPSMMKIIFLGALSNPSNRERYVRCILAYFLPGCSSCL